MKMRKNTMQMKDEIKKLYNIINDGVDEKYRIEDMDNIFFEESNPSKAPGTYIYEDSLGYHLDIVGDRGGIAEAKTTTNLEDIYFELCWTLASSISTLYAGENHEKGKDWRRIMFEKRIQLLKSISSDFAERGKQIIDEILENAPYDDELLGGL